MDHTFELRYSDYSLTDDQLAVRDAFREFFAAQCPAARVRAAGPLGFDAKLWSQFTELGATSMGLPENAGGDEAGLLDLVIVAEEVGTVLAPVAFAEHAAASRALAAFLGQSPAVTTDLLTAAERPLTLAVAPGAGRQLVPAGAVATAVLALDGTDLTLVEADAPPPPAPNQGSTPLARWDLGAGRRTVLASGPPAVAAYQDAVSEWKLLTAAALTGLTARALAIAVDFVTTRKTLGVPVGSLQGVSFPLTDVEIGVSGARNLIWQAAWLAGHEPGARPGAVEAAFANAAAVATHGWPTCRWAGPTRSSWPARWTRPRRGR